MGSDPSDAGSAAAGAGAGRGPRAGSSAASLATMKLIIRDDKDACGEYAAEYVRSRINAFAPTEDKPFVLGLPTGSTPIPTYKKLVQYVKEGSLSFKHIVTFNMDEYVGLAVDHPESYHSFMRVNLFDHVDIQVSSDELTLRNISSSLITPLHTKTKYAHRRRRYSAAEH